MIVKKANKMKKQGRQGDVLIERVDSIPVDAEPADHCTLAHGEMTGHSHRIAEGARMFVTAAGIQFVEVVGECAEVLHEEHGTITLRRPDKYQIIHQREYSPERNRAVID